jgi:hypothetical protein
MRIPGCTTAHGDMTRWRMPPENGADTGRCASRARVCPPLDISIAFAFAPFYRSSDAAVSSRPSGSKCAETDSASSSGLKDHRYLFAANLPESHWTTWQDIFAMKQHLPSGNLSRASE